MKSSYVDRAQKFVQEMAEYVSNWKNLSHIGYGLSQYAYDHPRRKVNMYNGLSRVAIITSDYVIKVDYTNDDTFGTCETEYNVYQTAKQDNMESLFAAVDKYEYNGICFYIMPRIHGVGTKWQDADCYMTEEEIKWCAKHYLWDLHYQNYGFRNGHVCLIDYACIYPEGYGVKVG